MKKAGLITAVVALVLVAASLVAFVFLSRSSSHPFADPADARCNASSASFGSAVVSATHLEFGFRFRCAGAQIAGTLNVPPGRGPFPAVVWVHGAGESARLPYDGAPLVQALVDSGIAVLSYDKRGVGESEGECCPGDYGQFNLLAADVDGAVAALRYRPEIDPSRIGLLGASQAGWVVPLAAVRSNGRVAFTALVDAPAVSTGEEDLYSQRTGEQGSLPRLASFVRTAGGLRTPGPAGFDPRQYLEQLESAGLWLYGGADRSQPTDDDVDVLNRLKAKGKDFTVLVYPEADHGLLDIPPTDPRALPQVVRWVKAQASRPQADQESNAFHSRQAGSITSSITDSRRLKPPARVVTTQRPSPQWLYQRGPLRPPGTPLDSERRVGLPASCHPPRPRSLSHARVLTSLSRLRGTPPRFVKACGTLSRLAPLQRISRPRARSN